MDLDFIIYPPGSIIFLTFLALFINLFVNLISKREIDYQRMRELQKIVKEYNELQKQLLRNPDDKKLKKKIDRMKPKANAAQAEITKMSMRPMLYTTIPIIAIFWILGGMYREIPVVQLPFPLPFVVDYFHGDSALSSVTLGYLGYYIIASYFFSMILQRILGTSLSS